MALIEINVHEHVDLGELRSAIARIDASLTALLTQGTTQMETLQTLKDDVAAEKTVIASAVALLNGLAAKVAALQPNQADIDALAAEIKSNTADLSAAVTANTDVPPAGGPA